MGADFWRRTALWAQESWGWILGWKAWLSWSNLKQEERSIHRKRSPMKISYRSLTGVLMPHAIEMSQGVFARCENIAWLPAHTTDLQKINGGTHFDRKAWHEGLCISVWAAAGAGTNGVKQAPAGCSSFQLRMDISYWHGPLVELFVIPT